MYFVAEFLFVPGPGQREPFDALDGNYAGWDQYIGVIGKFLEAFHLNVSHFLADFNSLAFSLSRFLHISI